MTNGTFSLAAEIPPIPGCTVSGEVLWNTAVFSLAAGTDISPESYPVRKLWLAARGEMTVLTEKKQPFHEGGFYVTPIGIPVGIQADTDSVIYGNSAAKGDKHESCFKRRRGIRPEEPAALSGGQDCKHGPDQ